MKCAYLPVHKPPSDGNIDKYMTHAFKCVCVCVWVCVYMDLTCYYTSGPPPQKKVAVVY